MQLYLWRVRLGTRRGLYADQVSSTKFETDIRAIQEAISKLVRSSRKAVLTSAGTVAPGMAPAAFVIMARIADVAPMSPAAIIAATGLARSVVSRQLTALVKEGYLVSEPDPRDGRVALFSPTLEAAAKFGDVSKDRRDGIADMLEGWTQEDVSTFVTLLERFAQSA